MDSELISLLKGYLKANILGQAGINIRGNRQILTYYTGVEAGNPSGQKNLKFIEFYDSSDLRYTETYLYDVDNDVIEIITS